MIRKIRLLIRKDKLLGKSSGYFSLLIWIIAGFAAKFSMIDQSYGYLIYFLWLNINFKASSLFTEDGKVGSLKLYKSIGVEYGDLIKARYIYITGYLIRNFLLALIFALGLDLIRNISYDPALNLGHIVYILAMTISLNSGFMLVAYQSLLENSRYLLLPPFYAIINAIFVGLINSWVNQNLRGGSLNRLNFSPIHYLTLIVLAIILSLISYFLSLKILKDGEL